MTNTEAAHNPATAYSPRDTDRLPKWQAIAAQTLASSVATINTNPTDDSSGLNPSGEQLPTRAPEAVTEKWGTTKWPSSGSRRIRRVAGPRCTPSPIE